MNRTPGEDREKEIKEARLARGREAGEMGREQVQNRGAAFAQTSIYRHVRVNRKKIIFVSLLLLFFLDFVVALFWS